VRRAACGCATDARRTKGGVLGAFAAAAMARVFSLAAHVDGNRGHTVGGEVDS